MDRLAERPLGKPQVEPGLREPRLWREGLRPSAACGKAAGDAEISRTQGRGTCDSTSVHRAVGRSLLTRSCGSERSGESPRSHSKAGDRAGTANSKASVLALGTEGNREA